LGRVDADGNPLNPLSSDPKYSLSGFKSTYLPDVECIKMVYSTYQAIAASGSQFEYVFRLNSLFDPDFTGAGGQPDGFDLWKNMYAQYRVVACLAQLNVAALAGSALIAMAPSPVSTALGNAEDIAGFRYAKSAIANVSGQVAKLKQLYRIGELAGEGELAILADNDWAAAVTGNPNQTQFLHILGETSGATDTVMFWLKLTYYARFERKLATEDVSRLHGSMFAARHVPRSIRPQITQGETTRSVEEAAASAVDTRVKPTLARVDSTNRVRMVAVPSDALCQIGGQTFLSFQELEGGHPQ